MADHGGNKYQVLKANGDRLPEGEPFMVFRAQDKYAQWALREYRFQLMSHGYSKEALEHMDEHIREFQAWPHQKEPD